MKKLFDGFVLLMVALVDTLVGNIVVFENSIGIAQTEGIIGEDISVDTVGVYELASADADLIGIGDTLYYDEANGLITIVTDTVGDGSGTLYPVAGTAWSTKGAGEVLAVAVKIG